MAARLLRARGTACNACSACVCFRAVQNEASRPVSASLRWQLAAVSAAPRFPPKAGCDTRASTPSMLHSVPGGGRLLATGLEDAAPTLQDQYAPLVLLSSCSVFCQNFHCGVGCGAVQTGCSDRGEEGSNPSAKKGQMQTRFCQCSTIYRGFVWLPWFPWFRWLLCLWFLWLAWFPGFPCILWFLWLSCFFFWASMACMSAMASLAFMVSMRSAVSMVSLVSMVPSAFMVCVASMVSLVSMVFYGLHGFPGFLGVYGFDAFHGIHSFLRSFYIHGFFRFHDFHTCGCKLTPSTGFK